MQSIMKTFLGVPGWMILLIFIFIPMTSGSILKVTGFKVPALVMYGSDVELDCPFSSPGRMKLYSVKWYQNSDEFFRYMFSDQTPVVAFALPGIKVDLSQSNSSRVKLKSVNFNTTATFRCEVSADEPDFQTVHRRANMTVIQVSGDGPLITGLRDRYELNDQLDVNCSAPSIKPDVGPNQVRLTWHMNNEPVPDGQIVKRLTPDSKSAAAINLRLTLTDRHFDNKTGLLKLNCTLTIGRSSNSQFNKSVEHMAALIHPTPVLEPRPTSPERSAKGKDYRSASYSSGGRRQYDIPLLFTFLIVVLFTATPFWLQ